jgi:hypothetical protein
MVGEYGQCELACPFFSILFYQMTNAKATIPSYFTTLTDFLKTSVEGTEGYGACKEKRVERVGFEQLFSSISLGSNRR